MFQNHIHNLRGLAILGIVGAHSIWAFRWAEGSLWFRALDTLCNQSSILFFFIAGYLFQHLSGRFTYPKYLKKKLTTVIIPYLLLSLPALIVSTGWRGEAMYPQDSIWPGFYDLPAWRQVIAFYLTGKHLAPFWFVPTIALFYLAAPVFLWADRKRWTYAILPVLLAWSFYSGRNYFFGPFGKATYLLSVYLMGMFFSRYKDQTMDWAHRLRWPLFVAVAALFWLNIKDAVPHHGIIFALKVCLAPLALHWLHRWNDVLGDRLDYLAQTSFGLFFVHGYFIAGLRLSYQYTTSHELPHANVVRYLLFAAFILLLSLLVLTSARRLFGKNSRMLVGC